MANTKQTGPDSPPPTGIGSRKRTEEVGPSGGEQRKKWKNDAPTESIKGKTETCKLQVDRPTLRPNDDVVQVIEGHGINVWFKPVGRFVLPICREFDQKLGVRDEDLYLLKTNLRGKVMEIIPGVIVKALHYQRPPPTPRSILKTPM
ncbi:unnamed protein product, partial [Ilex paraguariensis]